MAETMPIEEAITPVETQPTTSRDYDPVQILNDIRMSADEARLPHKELWDRNWALYNNQYDFSKKEDWQSKNFVPMISTIVRGIKYLMKQSLVSSGDFFDVEFNSIDKTNPQKDEITGWGKKIIRRLLDENRFGTVFGESIATSLLESLLILKVLPNGNSGVVISSLSSYKVRLDPTGRNRWKIHSIDTDLDLVIASAEKGVYDIEEVRKCQEEFSRDMEEYEDAVRKGQEHPKPGYRKGVIVDEFFGDLIDNTGKIIKKNCTFSVLNEKYLIRDVMEIPFEHKQCPVIVGAPNTKPKSVYHQAIISDVQGLAVMTTEYLNLTLDASLVSLLKNYEVNVDMIADPADFQDGIYPGKAYLKKTKLGEQGTDMIKEIARSSVNPVDLTIYEGLKQQIQQNVGWWDQFGQGTNRVTSTATEVDQRAQMTSQGMRAVAEELEDTVIVPMLEQVWSLTLQYFNDFDKLANIVPQELITKLKTTPNGMKAIFGDQASFKARGMSGVLARMEELNKVMSIANLLKMFPDALRFFEPQTLMKKAVRGIGWTPEEAGMKPQEMIQKEEQAQQQQQQQQQQMQIKMLQEKHQAEVAKLMAETQSKTVDAQAKGSDARMGMIQSQVELQQMQMRHRQEMEAMNTRHIQDMRAREDNHNQQMRHREEMNRQDEDNNQDE